MECRWLRQVIDQTGAQVVSSFLMRAHIVALLTKTLLAPRIHVVLNIHEHMSESAEHFYPYAADRALMRWVVRRLFPARTASWSSASWSGISSRTSACRRA